MEARPRAEPQENEPTHPGEAGRGGGRPAARRLRLGPGGDLYDLDERRLVELAELGEEVRAGRRFTARREGTGTDCTNEVLLEVVRAVLPRYLPWPGAAGPMFLLRRLLRGAADAFEPEPGTTARRATVRDQPRHRRYRS